MTKDFVVKIGDLGEATGTINNEPEEFAPFLFNATILTRPQPVWCKLLQVNIHLQWLSHFTKVENHLKIGYFWVHLRPSKFGLNFFTLKPDQVSNF